MKVESTFIIDGKIVNEAMFNPEITIFESKDQETLYIVSGKTGEVICKIEVTCEMSQGSGFVDSIKYTDLTLGE